MYFSTGNFFDMLGGCLPILGIYGSDEGYLMINWKIEVSRWYVWQIEWRENGWGIQEIIQECKRKIIIWIHKLLS